MVLKKKNGKKMWEKISPLSYRLHIKRALISIRLKRKTRRERESKYTRCSSMFFGLKLRCCRSKTTGGWIPYVPPPEDNFSCHVSQVRFLCSRTWWCVFRWFPAARKNGLENDCVDERFCLFFSRHTHLVLCVVNNKCLLSLDDDDDEDRSRWRNRWNRGNART